MEELQDRYSPAPADPADDHLDVRTVTATVLFESASGDLPTFVATELPLDPGHTRNGNPDSLFAYFAEEPANLSGARSIPIVIDHPEGDGLDVLVDLQAAHATVNPSGPTLETSLLDDSSAPAARSIVLQLTGGNDGLAPEANAYEGAEDATTGRLTGLKALEALEDISIVAAPGSTEFRTSRAPTPSSPR